MEKQPLYLTRPVSLSKSSGTIAIHMENEDGKKLIPVEQVQSIYVLTPMTMSSKLLELISLYEIPVHFFHYYGFYIGSYIPDSDSSGQSEIVIEQVLSNRNEKRRLMLAKEFLSGAQTNLLRNLSRLTRKSDFTISSKSKQSLEMIRPKVKSATTHKTLLGLEGKFRSIYYQSLDEYLKKEHPSYQIIKRTRRPPQNRMNTLISYLNSLLYATIIEELQLTPLHPGIPFLHSARDQRQSLALDISEVFKPVIVDRIILRLLSYQMLNELCFETKGKGCFLTNKGKQIVIKAYHQTLDTSIFHRQRKRSMTYRQLIRYECAKLVKHFRNYQPYRSFRMWW